MTHYQEISHDENILFWYLFAAIKLTTKSFLALKTRRLITPTRLNKQHNRKQE